MRTDGLKVVHWADLKEGDYIFWIELGQLREGWVETAGEQYAVEVPQWDRDQHDVWIEIEVSLPEGGNDFVYPNETQLFMKETS